MHDYSPSSSNATCLEFCTGQIIHVLNRDSSGWWDGELDGRRGWFPSNYVNDVSLGEQGGQDAQESAEDTVVCHPAARPFHRVTQSAASAASWATAPVNAVHAPQSSPSARTDEKDYCHPLMTPLLHGISLLQSAVRSNRITHFQPSTACIVSCIRSLLSATECLTRDSEPIQQFPALGHERKRILHTLGLLVPQAKKASDFVGDERARALEVDSMLRLSGQLFTAVRQFIDVAIHCGLELPERRATAAMLDSDSPTTPLTGGSEHIGRNWDVTNALVRTPRRPDAAVSRTPLSALRSRSMVNLRTPKPPPLRGQPSRAQPMAMRQHHGHRPAMESVSSTASSTSASSSTASTSAEEQEHVPAPPPPFPRGPTAAVKVLEALRITHDHYLSTIAAFIGHAHSHSRTSHASSTGHMYDLVREIVEMVCRLLTIVDAVMRHPGVPALKLDKLRVAKEGLYSVTSSLAESVRLLTTPLAETSEDEEKQVLLRSATDALKAGADCVFSVKTCLNRSPGERPFIIMMAEVGPQRMDEGSFVGPSQGADAAPNLRRSSSMSSPLSVRSEQEEDVTVRLEPVVPQHTRELSPASEQSGSSKHSLDSVPITPEESLHPAPYCTTPAESDLLSLASPSDDGTAWEASSQNQVSTQRILQEKIVNGQLPSIPCEPGFLQDAEAWMLSHDYSMDDVAYNNDGHLVGATIPVLLEKMTPHDVVVDPAFQAIFFLTFRLFSTPVDLVDSIINRYSIDAPYSLGPDDRALWQKRKGVPVRLRVTNLVRLWLEQHWQHASDHVVIDSLMHFARQGISGMFPGPAQRIVDLLEMRRLTGESAKNERRGDPGMSINPPGAAPPSEIPRPSMTKSLLSLLRSRSYGAIQITDFDALELARQLTIREAELYGAIVPEEVLQTGQDGAATPNVKAMSRLSTTVTGWVAESILNEHDTKKRTGLVKFFIKLADRCVSIKNYSTSRSILAALDSSTISRLHQTWNGLPQKNRNQLEALRKLAEHSRNYHHYRTVLRNTAPPAVPFLGLYLTDVTFCREGNPSTRVSPLNPDKKLINFNKYHKLARIVQDMQRFQVPYQLRKITEVEKYLDDAFAKAGGHGDLQDLYRRSLLVEPKQAADAPPSSDVGKIFGRL